MSTATIPDGMIAADVDRLRDRIIDVVARCHEVSPKDLRSPSRGIAPVALARQVVMYLLRVEFCVSATQVGKTFSRDRTTVTHACKLVEDLRDNYDFDVLIDELAGRIRKIEKMNQAA